MLPAPSPIVDCPATVSGQSLIIKLTAIPPRLPMPPIRQFLKERVRREDELRTARARTSIAPDLSVVESRVKEINDDGDGEEEVSEDGVFGVGVVVLAVPVPEGTPSRNAPLTIPSIALLSNTFRERSNTFKFDLVKYASKTTQPVTGPPAPAALPAPVAFVIPPPTLIPKLKPYPAPFPARLFDANPAFEATERNIRVLWSNKAWRMGFKMTGSRFDSHKMRVRRPHSMESRSARISAWVDVKEMPVRSRVRGAGVEVGFGGIITEPRKEVDNVVKELEVICRSKAWEMAGSGGSL